MRKSYFLTVLAGSLMLPVLGCGASSGEEQRRALTYQQRSDDAASKGEYGRAGEEQRKAQDAHHDAVNKALDEGKPLPPQPRQGDVPPPPDRGPGGQP
jgi:hypothetical protein